MMQAKPYTPETLAERWGCSATTIRNLCGAGEIEHFRLGRMYRIPAHVVEGLEGCQKSPSENYEAATRSTGKMMSQANDAVISLRHAPARKRKQKAETPTFDIQDLVGN